MPRIKPLGDSAKAKARWQKANENFDFQIGVAMVQTKLTAEALAKEIGISRSTLAKWRKDCSQMTIAGERKLILAFERLGIRYDRMLGEGAAT